MCEHVYTPQNIEAVLKNPNIYNPNEVSEMLNQGCFTLEDLKKNGLNAQQQHLLEKAQRRYHEKKDYKDCLSGELDYAKLKHFDETYPDSIHYKEIHELLGDFENDKRLFDALVTEVNLADDLDKKMAFVEKFRKDNPLNRFNNKLDELKVKLLKEYEKKQYDNLLQEISQKSSLDDKLSLIDTFKVNNPFSSYIKELDSLKEKITVEYYDNAYKMLLANLQATSDGKEKIRLIESFNIDQFPNNIREQIEKKKSEILKILEEQLEKQRQEEERRRKEQERINEDENAWIDVLYVVNSSCDPIIKLNRLDNYYAMYSIHRDEVDALRQQVNLEKDAMPEIDSTFKDPNSDVINYLRLIEKYPFKKDYICIFMLDDMKKNPSKYDREEMVWLLKGKHDDLDKIDAVFTEAELVEKHILSYDYINYIKSHPKDNLDRDPLEDAVPKEENFDSHENNTDIYFFGVPGSGKTTVLAGLFNIEVEDKLRLKLIPYGDHKGFNYASILKGYLQRNLFPQRTKTKFVDQKGADGDRDPALVIMHEEIGDKYIQIIDAQIIDNYRTENEHSHQLSIIEMPGERTLQFAAANVKDLKHLDDLLGTGTRQLFMNNNRKVFFFVIDPDPQKTYDVSFNGNNIKVTQAQALSMLADFLKSVPGLLNKVDSIHIILTKSDMLKNSEDPEELKDYLLDKDAYKALVDDIADLCKPCYGDVNKQCGHRPYLFTFSLGKVLPGHLIEYRKRDAAKILKVMAANTYGVSVEPTKWDSIVEWMNK